MLGRERPQFVHEQPGRGVDVLVGWMVAEQLGHHLTGRDAGSQPFAVVNEPLPEPTPFLVCDLLEPTEVHGHRLGVAEQPRQLGGTETRVERTGCGRLLQVRDEPVERCRAAIEGRLIGVDRVDAGAETADRGEQRHGDGPRHCVQ